MPEKFNKRMHQCLYSNDGREELCERVCKLEMLAKDMWPHILDAYYSGEMSYEDYVSISDRMQELGVHE